MCFLVDWLKASRHLLRALKEMQSYLRISAPFDGVITERLVHPGALIRPGADSPLMVLQPDLEAETGCGGS